ncbi:MAG: hypothetical protein ACR2NA_04235 [Solirubrobacterales bacterium]
MALTPEAARPTIAPQADADSLVVDALPALPDAPPGSRLMRLTRTVIRVMRDAALDGRASEGFGGRYRRIRAAYSGSWPRPLAAVVHVVITRGLWRSSLLRRLLVRLDLGLTATTCFDDLFARHEPDLVVGSGLGYFPHDDLAYREAARHGIPVAALVSGWDNPSTKGYRSVDFRGVAVWSQRMRDAVVRLHDLDPARVAVAGVPHWDLYARPDELMARAELFDRLGLDLGKRMILHATFPPSGGRNEEFLGVASGLARAVSTGELGDGLQLVIRLHPKFVGPENAEARRPYEELARSRDVHINVPDLIEAGPLRHEPTLFDARLLAALLRHCEVLVNLFSTTTLEAFALDRPVVMVQPQLQGPPGKANLDPSGWGDFVHLGPIVDGGGTRVAVTTAEMAEHVRQYLADPSLDTDERRATAELECGPLDGRAGHRTALALLEMVGIRPPTDTRDALSATRSVAVR